MPAKARQKVGLGPPSAVENANERVPGGRGLARPLPRPALRADGRRLRRAGGASPSVRGVPQGNGRAARKRVRAREGSVGTPFTPLDRMSGVPTTTPKAAHGYSPPARLRSSLLSHPRESSAACVPASCLPSGSPPTRSVSARRRSRPTSSAWSQWQTPAPTRPERGSLDRQRPSLPAGSVESPKTVDHWQAILAENKGER